MILFTCMNSKDANNKSYMYKDNFKMHSRVAEQLVGQLHQHQSILDLIQSDLFHGTCHRQRRYKNEKGSLWQI